MKVIVISGPSCSGKTILSKKLSKFFKDTVIIKTDSYYRDNIYIKFLSLFSDDIYDRIISIKKKEITKTLSSINNKRRSITFYNYDFRKKKSKKLTENIQPSNNSRFVIIEGIFAHRLDLNYKNTINIICEEKKNICYKRRITRDRLQRGRSKKEVIRRFSKSWNLYFTNLKRYSKNNQVSYINTTDKLSFENLISRLKNIH